MGVPATVSTLGVYSARRRGGGQFFSHLKYYFWGVVKPHEKFHNPIITPYGEKFVWVGGGWVVGGGWFSKVSLVLALVQSLNTKIFA